MKVAIRALKRQSLLSGGTRFWDLLLLLFLFQHKGHLQKDQVCPISLGHAGLQIELSTIQFQAVWIWSSITIVDYDPILILTTILYWQWPFNINLIFFWLKLIIFDIFRLTDRQILIKRSKKSIKRSKYLILKWVDCL